MEWSNQMGQNGPAGHSGQGAHTANGRVGRPPRTQRAGHAGISREPGPPDMPSAISLGPTGIRPQASQLPPQRRVTPKGALDDVAPLVRHEPVRHVGALGVLLDVRAGGAHLLGGVRVAPREVLLEHVREVQGRLVVGRGVIPR